MSDGLDAAHAASIRRATRLDRMVALLVGALVGTLAFGRLWPHRLDDPSVLYGILSLPSFLVRTFEPHLGLLLLALVPLAALRRRRRTALAALAIGLAALAPLAWSLRPRDRAVGADEPVLVVMSANLMRGAVDLAALRILVERERPDVLMLQEVGPDLAPRIEATLGDLLPASTVVPTSDTFGAAVLSRLPALEPGRPAPADDWRTPQPTLRLAFDGRPLAAVGIHLMVPLGRQLVARQRADVVRLARDLPDLLAQHAGAVVLAGDFNATPSSPHLSRLRAAGLHDAHDEGGAGPGLTWPRQGALRHLPGIRLDQLLAGPALRCVDARVLEDIGSDHAPIVGRFVWRK